MKNKQYWNEAYHRFFFRFEKRIIFIKNTARDSNEMCLTNISDDSLTRRPFRMIITLSSQDKQMSFMNSLINCDCIETYIVINKTIVPEVCERLQIESYSFFKLKPLREYDDQLIKKLITHCLLFILKVQDHKEESCSILITQLKHHNLIFEKS